MLGGVSAFSAQIEDVKIYQLAWKGTPVSITVWARSAADCEAVFAVCRDELGRLEQHYASYRQGSIVNRLNQQAGRQPVSIDAETMGLLQKAGHWHEQTEGAFDITLASYLWQYGFGQDDYRVPSELRLAQFKSLVNFNYIDIRTKEKEVLFRRDGMQIELDSMIINHAFKRLRMLLKKSKKAQSLRLSIGKNSLVYGKPPQGDVWEVPLLAPGKNNHVLAGLTEKNGNLFVADIYENSFEKKGKRYHVYLDVKTGRPAAYHQAAYLWQDEKVKQDLPVAVLMVLPAEKGLNLVNENPNMECVIIGSDNTLYFSEGWKKTLKVRFP